MIQLKRLSSVIVHPVAGSNISSKLVIDCKVTSNGIWKNRGKNPDK